MNNLAIRSRYVFIPEIFDYLDRTSRGKNNEIQLTDAMRLMVKEKAMYGLQFDGVRYDIGNKLDFIKTNLIYGLSHPEIGAQLKQWLMEKGYEDEGVRGRGDDGTTERGSEGVRE